ncbi:MAG: DNA-processing protein DprA, partial [Candidatus Moraniibacteriota bacterium]
MKYLHALNKIEGVGSRKIKKLLTFFNSQENIWNANISDLKTALGENKLAEKIFNEKSKIDPDYEWVKLEKENIRIIKLSDPEYPALLKEIHNPPYLIYTRGKLDFNQHPTIAIVGSRKYSSYGAQIAANFSRDLTNAGFIIVSGLALGIDAIAHRNALDTNGKTIAVLGSSIDNQNIYPRANYQLAQDIIFKDGLLLSDYPPETPASSFTFPARNRLIAGLSLGTLIIEAGEKSGALITARMALENNREVFAIPGSIFSENSIGTNNLIKNGAKLVTNLGDILEEL